MAVQEVHDRRTRKLAASLAEQSEHAAAARTSCYSMQRM